MKKLLSLLSILIISGTASPTTIATNSYQKQEKLSNNINYQQKNNLEYLKRNKRDIKNIVIKTTGGVFSSGVVLNNKLYFGSRDHNVYEYDPVTEQQKIVIKTQGEVWTSGVVFNNKVYFGSDDHNVYEYDPVTEQQKNVIKTNNFVRTSGIVLNNKLYFGSGDNNIYEYDPVTEQQKIVIKTQGEVWSTGTVLNNKLYFGSRDHNVYEYDSVIEQQKIVIKTQGEVWSAGIICTVFNNKVYFGSDDHNVYEYDPVTEQQKIVIKTNNIIRFSGTVFNNKVYFGSDDHNVYEYDPVTEQQKIVIKTNNFVRSCGIVFNNKLYFGSWDYNLYQYDSVTKQQKIIVTTNGWIESSGVVFNNKLYFGSEDHNVYEYSEYYLNWNLGKINNNSDKAILNELNYLNPDLNISQLEIIHKTNTSATIIKSKDSKNFTEIIVNYKIKNKNEISNINLNELIKKSLFFNFRDENINSKFKEINYIDTNNLNFLNVEVTKKENSFLSSIVIKNICNNKEFINKTQNVKSFNIPACIYNSKYKLTFQILTGLIKNKKNKLNGWNINYDDEMKLTDFINSNYTKNSEIINELSNNFDLSNTNKQEQETIIFSLNEPSNKFYINPNEKLQINYSSLRTIKSQSMLNLKQNIMGIISAKITNFSNEEKIVILSIKEAMQILQKYSLLPNKIIINNNSITFNGKAYILSEIEGKIKQSIVTSII